MSDDQLVSTEMVLGKYFSCPQIKDVSGNCTKEFILDMVEANLDAITSQIIIENGVYSYREFEAMDYPDEGEPRAFDIWVNIANKIPHSTNTPISEITYADFIDPNGRNTPKVGDIEVGTIFEIFNSEGEYVGDFVANRELVDAYDNAVRLTLT